MTKLLFSSISLILSLTAFSQTKSLQAIKINQFVKIDGNPDDDVWKNIAAVSGFITSTPVFGKEASKQTEVKIGYDNTAVYVLAYLYDDPQKNKKAFNRAG